MKKIWRSEKGDVWVEQDGENLLFYSESTEKNRKPKPTVVSMNQLQEIVDNTEDPEELGYSKLTLSKQKSGGED